LNFDQSFLSKLKKNFAKINLKKINSEKKSQAFFISPSSDIYKIN
jgi:hypothetical protein